MGSIPVTGGESDTPMGGALNPESGGTVNTPSGGTQAMGGSPVSDVMDPPAFSMPNEAVACQRNESFEALLPILRGGRTHIPPDAENRPLSLTPAIEESSCLVEMIFNRRNVEIRDQSGFKETPGFTR